MLLRVSLGDKVGILAFWWFFSVVFSGFNSLLYLNLSRLLLAVRRNVFLLFVVEKSLDANFLAVFFLFEGVGRFLYVL